jgi:hypothetical protein
VIIRSLSGFSRSFSSADKISTAPTLSHPTSSEPALNTFADGSRVQEQASRLIQALDLGARPLSLSREDGAGAAGAVSALLEALDLAAAQSAEEIADLTPPEQDTIEVLNEYIATGELPGRGAYRPESVMAQLAPVLQDDEWFDARSSVSEESEPWSDAHSMQSWQSGPWEDALSHISSLERGACGTGSLAGSETSGDTAFHSVIAGGDEPVRRLNRVLELLSRTLQNDFADDHARRAANVANDILRNVASVGAPTFIRQALAYAIERGLSAAGAGVAARTALGAVAGALPLALNVAGLVRDNFEGTATTQSNAARGLNLAIGASTLAVAGATGSLPALAATLTAYNLVYSVLRDAVESTLRLRDNANAQNARSIAAFTATTAVNQFVANALMAEGASPSGQMAAAQGWPALNDLTRAVINTASQTAGDFLSYVFIDRLSLSRPSEPLRAHLEAGLPSVREAANSAFNRHAARALTTNNVTVLSDVLGKLVDTIGLSTGQAFSLKAAIFGGLSAAHYPLTALSLMQRPRPSASDAESAREAQT